MRRGDACQLLEVGHRRLSGRVECVHAIFKGGQRVSRFKRSPKRGFERLDLIPISHTARLYRNYRTATGCYVLVRRPHDLQARKACNFKQL
jgi:hypothetical protein